MGAALSSLVFAIPTLLVCVAYFALRNRPSQMRIAMLLVIGVSWAAAIWFWLSYNQQQNDVGLMVDGILASATSVAALIASLAALLLMRKV